MLVVRLGVVVADHGCTRTVGNPWSCIFSIMHNVLAMNHVMRYENFDCMTLGTTERDRLSASSDIPKKEGAKDITLFLSLQNGRPRTAFELSKLYSYRTMARENGLWARRAWLGLVRPFPRERGGVPMCTPICVNGEGWGRGWRALAYPLPVPVCTPSARMGKGGTEGGVPSRRAYGVARRREKGGAGGYVHPFCTNREEGREWERGRCREAGRCALIASPFRANGEWRGRGWRALACPLSARTGQRGQGKWEAEGDREGRRAFMRPSTRMGKGGAGDSVPLCPPFRANRAGRPRGKRWDWRCALVRPARMGHMGEGEVTGETVRLPRGWGGADRGGGQCGGRGSRGATYPGLRANGAAGDASSFRRKWAEMGGRRGWEGEGREEKDFAHPILYESGGTQDSGGKSWGGAPECAHGTLSEAKRACHGLERPFPLLSPPASSPTLFAYPICVEKGPQKGRPTPPSPASRAERGARGGGGGGGAREHAAATLSPVRGTPFVRKGDTRGYGTPCPLPSSFARKGAQRGHTTPPLCVAPFAPPRSCGKGNAGACHPVPPFPIRVEGVHTGTPPPTSFPLGRAAPYTREGGTRGHAIPGPTLPHSRRWGCTRARRLVRVGRGARGQAMPASPRVAQQGRHSLRASTFTAPTARFRAP
ncbi:hypothetical protein EDB83DRAFT_2316843 [Lactarius deliciosus]|nr:hypothetical protein EDB83DRAFT_2316843 [Lactarius deliciosus]